MRDIFQVLYASLPDFLLDLDQAQNFFFIDTQTWNAPLAILAFRRGVNEGKSILRLTLECI